MLLPPPISTRTYTLVPYTTLFRSVHLIFACVLGSRTVSGFEHGNGVRQVGARSNTDTAHLRGQRVGNVVAVQVQGGDHVVFGRTQQDLLQEGVGDDVFNRDLTTRLGVLEFRSEEHTSELQSLMRNTYAVLCLKQK